ncbi:Maleylacetoacetate isomerase [Basidiobolus meristosporus CBS 931.73]|uniref:Maleylacetoacetate isomerase n=1 Tax=Basidiobolus meristosporus CBS 931.73 TaxID=1314790 RepID=A0A1Y1YYZ2_9FUNG|nr:Maleylacetoacetate isomerase [Basidiobolus meristosporus CBS 931.73]|eukprot:ORY03260.1 Maleylacetoacetate isomerase [Basidiobolus meristosporus CBS 931.73]
MTISLLYTYFRSACSARVRIALNLKEIDYEPHFVNLLNGDQSSEEYSKKNPQKLVPTLEIDGHTFSQSMAILEYLEETRPEYPLLPKDPAKRAEIRGLAYSIVADIQPVQNLRVLNYVGDDKKVEWGKHWITVGFEGIEKSLEKTAGKYCFGDEITLMDVCLAPQLYNAKRFGVDMSRFPIITRIDEELSHIEAFKAAHWQSQPDCPASLK